MPKSSVEITTLSEMSPGSEADLFVLLCDKELASTKDGKPFYKVTFRDRHRESKIPIWADVPFFNDCRDNWAVGQFYKIRATLRPTHKFGLQLEIRKIRLVTEADKTDGFDPNLCRPSSRAEPEAMHAEILDLAKKHILADKQEKNSKLLKMITMIFKDFRNELLESAAAKRHHHTYFGGLLEHTLSVTKIAISIAEHFLTDFHDSREKCGCFSKPLVVAGAILHDIGKIREQRCEIATSQYTFEGQMIGHIVLGRDFVRDYGRKVELDAETQTHLEHIILSHQRLADWGSPKPPMSIEAVIVHHADSVDALIGCHFSVLQQDDTDGQTTASRNILGYSLFKNTVKLEGA